MVQVKVSFCQCGHLPHAIDLGEQVFSTYGSSLAGKLSVSLEATPCGPCHYDVSIDGKTLKRPSFKAVKEKIDAGLKLELRKPAKPV